MVIIVKRNEVRKIKIGDVVLGNDEVIIQSMCSIKTSSINEVVNQINNCVKLGAKLMRVSIKDEEDAFSIKEIKKHINCPLIGDIHFDPKLALLAMDNGIDKIRINPGNIPLSTLKEIVNKAKEKNVVIRIGVNSGSMDEDSLKENDNKITAISMINLASKYIKFFEENDFYNLVISLKSS